MRMLFSIASPFLIYFYPKELTTWFYIFILLASFWLSFCSNVMFVSQGAFFAKISDTSIGGTYLTLLNTCSNLGSIWPKFIIFWAIDTITESHCALPKNNEHTASCHSVKTRQACQDLNGTCKIDRDGFYYIAAFGITAGVCVLFIIRKVFAELQKAKDSSWKISYMNSIPNSIIIT